MKYTYTIYGYINITARHNSVKRASLKKFEVILLLTSLEVFTSNYNNEQYGVKIAIMNNNTCVLKRESKLSNKCNTYLMN